MSGFEIAEFDDFGFARFVENEILFLSRESGGGWRLAEKESDFNEKTEAAIALRDSLKNADGFNVSKVDKVVYWHHTLAFFLALKIARISMSIFKNEQ